MHRVETESRGIIISVNGPIVRVRGLEGAGMLHLTEVGPDRLIGEIIRLDGDISVVQVYEDNTGLRPGDEVISTGRPLSVLLGPGLLSGIYDGIQRPLVALSEASGSYIRKGVKIPPLDSSALWHFTPLIKEGDMVREGIVIGEVPEKGKIVHRIMVPPGIKGKISMVVPEGDYSIESIIYETSGETIYKGALCHYWPVRKPRPVMRKYLADSPLVTGQRVIDTFFPISRGGTAAIPGGFGTGKTMTQHALAKWCDADIIVYIGCGERGNEMTDVLNEFPKLVDPATGRPLMERTVMIANTSNMPVPAREVSIYTGVTLAEYYRDMGYNVAVMADSTSRWAEALRELSSRMGDMPAEEGFPPGLATRLAEFYERAGAVKTLGGGDGSITIIGAVSPPGGDFSEPVTQNTTRFVRCFWALDRILADARHYPSISWIDSYSEYQKDMARWWDLRREGHSKMRSQGMELLLEDHRLEQIVRLVGQDSLPERDRFVLVCAELIKNGFLQQNSFDPKDMYCGPDKQIALLSLIVDFYHEGLRMLGDDVPLSEIMSLDMVAEISRLKSQFGNEEVKGIEEFRDRLMNFLSALKGRSREAAR